MMYLRIVTLIAAVATTAAVAVAGTTIRPIEDFLSMQGTSGLSLLEPDPDGVGWDNSVRLRPDEPLLLAFVDYAGLANAYAPGEEPEIDGTVIERTLKDGRVEVTVVLHSRGVNAWVMELSDPFSFPSGPCFFPCQVAGNPTLFGHRPGEVRDGAEQALADTFLKVVFINSGPGDPLPDLLPLVVCPDLPPGTCPEGEEFVPEVKFLHFSANASGPLTAAFGVEEGTPGRCSINDNGVFVNSGGPTADGYRVANIKLTVVGK